MCRFLTDPKANAGNNWLKTYIFFRYYCKYMLDRACLTVYSDLASKQS